MNEERKESIINWLRANKEKLNMSQIARDIGFKNPSSLSIFISDKPRVNGYDRSISDEKLNRLEQYIDNFKN